MVLQEKRSRENDVFIIFPGNTLYPTETFVQFVFKEGYPSYRPLAMLRYWDPCPGNMKTTSGFLAASPVLPVPAS